MATVTLTLTDNEDGTMNIGADFGEAFNPESRAHQAGEVLLQSVLGSASNYQTIEDTAPGCKAEPSRIIVPGA
jgi:hypothetical protein